MSLYNDASLVMVPSAIKDGKLYSIRPTDGSGDFTFSRGSNLSATRVDVNGLIEKGRENLLLQSNQFDTTWVNANSVETSGQSGYDGSSDAWLLTKTGVSGRITQTISVSGVFTYSIYAKADTSNWILLYKTGTGEGGRFFDLENGVIGSSVATAPIDSKIESIGNGWYRCSIVGNSATAAVVYVADSNGSATGTSGSIYIQDAQLEVGLVATDYIETTTTTAVSGITEDLPRLDYSGGASCPSLLLEPQRTNLVTNSEYISGNPRANVTLTDNYGTSPEGVQNSTLVEVTSAAQPRIELLGGSSWSNSTTYTASSFVKQGTGRYVGFGLYSAEMGDEFIKWDLTDGTATTQSSISGGAVWSETGFEDFGNGWYRISATITTEAVNNIKSGFKLLAMSAASAGLGVVGETFEYYGLQLEASSSYPTSYIPTYGTSQTRSSDKCYNTSATSLIGQEQGTILIDADFNKNNQSDFYFAVSNGTLVNSIYIYQPSGGNLTILIRSLNNTTTYNLASAVWSEGRNKIAIGYNAESASIYLNGELKLSYDHIGLPSTNQVNISSRPDNLGSLLDASLYHQVLLYKTQLTDSECIALTS